MPSKWCPTSGWTLSGAGRSGTGSQTLAQALAVADRVKWWGEYPDEDLPRRMADADFLVLPSVTTDEMFGMVLLEAMAAGRPVITTAVPSGVREVNEAGVTGLEVPIRDAGALAEAMRTLAEDPALRERMGAAGRAKGARALHGGPDGRSPSGALRKGEGSKGLLISVENPLFLR